MLALAFAGGWWGVERRKKRDWKTPLRNRRISKAADRVLAQMDAAARRGDPERFFNCARSAVQQTLAARWRLAAEQITTAEVDARIGGQDHDIPRLFALADEAKYSGRDLHTTDFARWMQIVRQQLLADKAP